MPLDAQELAKRIRAARITLALVGIFSVVIKAVIAGREYYKVMNAHEMEEAFS